MSRTKMKIHLTVVAFGMASASVFAQGKVYRMPKHLFIYIAAFILLFGVSERTQAQSGGFTTIRYPNSISTYANGINNAGDIVGTYGTGAVQGERGFKLSKQCKVPPLSPITDSLALEFEAQNGKVADVTRLTQAMTLTYNDFKSRIQISGGQLKLSSAYRPPAYQLHLQEVWIKWQALKIILCPNVKF